jgi:hypothetical protein
MWYLFFWDLQHEIPGQIPHACHHRNLKLVWKMWILQIGPNSLHVKNVDTPSHSMFVPHLNNSGLENADSLNRSTPRQKPGTLQSTVFKRLNCSGLANVDSINWSIFFTCSNHSKKFLHFNIWKAKIYRGVYTPVMFQRQMQVWKPMFTW